jgi:predicted Zn-dependent protease with MMP-like domain
MLKPESLKHPPAILHGDIVKAITIEGRYLLLGIYKGGAVTEKKRVH